VSLVVAATQSSNASRRVLDSAAKLFVEQGYPGTTLREIASAAGIKAGSIYHHFDSKEALFVAVLNDGMAVMVDAFDEVSADAAGASVSDQVHAHVRAHLSAVFENGPYTTAHVTSFFTAPAAVRSQVVPVRDGYEKKWNTLFKQLFPSLTRREIGLHRLILFGAMNASTEWFDPAGSLSVNGLASTISNQFLHGVQA